MSTILLLHGPNLNLLGTRETSIYGSSTLQTINDDVAKLLSAKNHQLISYQSNHEGCLVDRIQQVVEESVDLIIFNPAAYTHTSVAIRDALLAVSIAFYEVHLSDPKSREEFRHHSYFSDIALAVYSGLGAESYIQAAKAAIKYLDHQKKNTQHEA